MLNPNVRTARTRQAGKSARLGLGVIALAALWLTAQSSAQAATTPAPALVSSAVGSAVGSVDMQKVFTGYNKRGAADDAIKAQANLYLSAFNLQKADNMLSAADQQSLGALLLKQAQTPADQAQITALQTRSQADASELTALQQKPNLTPADTARLAALTKEQRDGAQALQDVNASYSQLVDQKNQQQSDSIMSLIKAAVASVAQTKGLVIVFDSSVAIYAGNDITQLVIDRLNAAK